MSDDEDVVYKKRENTIHYGSLEESERLRQQLEEIQSDEEEEFEPEVKKPAISTSTSTVNTSTSSTLQSGSINISNEYYELEQEM